MSQDQEQTSASPRPAEIPSAQMQVALEALRSEQNLPAAVFMGLIAAIAGALVWGVVSALTHYQIGWMAIGIGFLVGTAVRFAGKGIDAPFGVAGAALSLLGCMLGNLLTMSYFIADKEQIPLAEFASQMSFDLLSSIMVSTFNGMDIVFYGIALYFGYKYAFRQVTPQELGVSVEKTA
jgi:hypothetical protein